jgi:UDP-glucose 4-epimerase
MAARLEDGGHQVMRLDWRWRDVDKTIYPWDIGRPFPDDLLPTFDWIFHFAGLAAVPPSMQQPAEYMAVNTQGTVNALEFARKTGASRFIYAASGTCYGNMPPMPTPETAPIDCATPYALSKWMGEELVRHWDRVFDVPSVSLRLFSPYGPGMGLTSAMGHFLKLKREGKPIQITGDGEQYRDMHFVSDTIEAFVLAAQSDLRDVAINIGSGEPVTLNQLADGFSALYFAGSLFLVWPVPLAFFLVEEIARALDRLAKV